MSDYCSASDVQAEFKNTVFSASTVPTSTTVGTLIARSTGIIEAKVGMKYAVPVTAASALVVLKDIAVNLVAGKIKNIVAVKSGTQDVNQGKRGDGDTMIKYAMDLLEQIRKGEILLAGASLVSTSDGVSSGNVDNGISAVFTRDTDQW